ncbi:acyltransferase domain-containing protein [Stackebrandtia albiflava]|nr:acyltransferase domain-containing protein [Stackebrandtia albiflava]
MNPTRLEDRLGLAEADKHWYQTWEDIGAPDGGVALPSAADTERLLVDHLTADPEDAAAVAQARPDPERDPELWWVLERCHRQLRADMGGTGMLMWPKLSRELGAPGRFVYLWALLSVMRHTLEYHQARGVPPQVSWATFGNIGEKLRLNRARYGEPGLEVAFWFTLHFRGAIYRLGRLEFCLEPLGPGHPFNGHDEGEMTLGIHIPGEGGPFSPQACRLAVDTAEEFFPVMFGDRFTGRPVYTCTSWLLDPRLGKRLAPGSNITVFQNRFELMPPGPKATENGEKDVLLFAFNHVGPYDPARLPRSSTLLRVLADGFQDGTGWQVRSGIWRR